MAEITCENCGKQLHLSDVFAGQTKTCVCGHQFVVPGKAPNIQAKLANVAPRRAQSSRKALVLIGVAVLGLVVLGSATAGIILVSRGIKTVTQEECARISRGMSKAAVEDIVGSEGEMIFEGTGGEGLGLMMTLSAPNLVALEFIADEEKMKYYPDSADPVELMNTMKTVSFGYYRWRNGDGTGLHATFVQDHMVWFLYEDAAMVELGKRMADSSDG